MKLIIGLGNPGEKYKSNRHNIGHLVVGELLKRPLPKNTVVKKTDCFMNESGETVRKLVNQYKIKTSDLWIVHDDLDIPLGSYKIQFGKGPKEHKGLLSIYKELGTKDFWHVRVGIDNRMANDKWPMPNGKNVSGEEYVLQDFTNEELKRLNKVIEDLTNELIV